MLWSWILGEGELRCSAARAVRALREHQLETAPDLLVARLFKRRDRGGLVEELLAADAAATADQPRFADQGPAAEQVGLKHQLHEARGFVVVRTLLQEQAHGAPILRHARASQAPSGLVRTEAGGYTCRSFPGKALRMRGFDFSSWSAAGTTLLGLVLFSLVAIGIRLVFMQALQRRRERENRQINERLKTLISAYKTLGGSFTGDLDVDPTHLRQLRARMAAAPAGEAAAAADVPATVDPAADEGDGSDRRRRIRDAVEAALSDVILLGTDEQVRLAAAAAGDMAAGRTVRTAELVVSLRDFIRHALDLDPIPQALAIPDQGPLRVAGSGGKGGSKDGGGRGGGGGGGGGGGMGMGMGVGMGAGAGRSGQGDGP